MCLVLNAVDLSKKKHSFYYGVGKYGKYGKYGNYGSYGSYGKYGKYGTYGQYGSYGNYSNSHYAMPTTTVSRSNQEHTYNKEKSLSIQIGRLF